MVEQRIDCLEIMNEMIYVNDEIEYSQLHDELTNMQCDGKLVFGFAVYIAISINKIKL